MAVLAEQLPVVASNRVDIGQSYHATIAERRADGKPFSRVETSGRSKMPGDYSIPLSATPTSRQFLRNLHTSALPEQRTCV